MPRQPHLPVLTTWIYYYCWKFSSCGQP